MNGCDLGCNIRHDAVPCTVTGETGDDCTAAVPQVEPGQLDVPRL